MLQNLQQADRSTVNTNNLPNAPPMPVSQLNQSNSRSANRSSLAEVIAELFHSKVVCLIDVVNGGVFPQKLLDRFDYDDDPEDVQTSENNIQLQ